jgi:hypothetical protein
MESFVDIAGLVAPSGSNRNKFGVNYKAIARSGHIEPLIPRHGRAWPGHPRLLTESMQRKTWMPKRGHDGGE